MTKQNMMAPANKASKAKTKVSNPTDATNFRASESGKPPQVKYVDDGSGWDDDFATSV